MVDVIIIGGGRVGIHLIEKLKKDPKYNITLIDDNEENMKELKKKYEDVNIIIGNATKGNTLQKAGIENGKHHVFGTEAQGDHKRMRRSEARLRLRS